jgi:hypothetical protein
MTALIVGTVLTAINHGPAIVAGRLTRERAFEIVLTMVVPYLASTTSSVLTHRKLASNRGGIGKAIVRLQQIRGQFDLNTQSWVRRAPFA